MANPSMHKNCAYLFFCSGIKLYSYIDSFLFVDFYFTFPLYNFVAFLSSDIDKTNPKEYNIPRIFTAEGFSENDGQRLKNSENFIKGALIPFCNIGQRHNALASAFFGGSRKNSTPDSQRRPARGLLGRSTAS